MHSLTQYIQESLIFESVAMFPGQLEMAQKITNDIIKVKTNKIDLTYTPKDFKNCVDFFVELHIKNDYQEDSSVAAYESSSKFDDDNRILKGFIYVSNEAKTYKKDRLIVCIAHELKHMWQDYKIHFHNNEWLFNNAALDDSYQSALQNLGSEDDIDSVISTVIYQFFKYERDAFAAEFATEMTLAIKKAKPKSLQDCKEIFRKSDIYDTYYELIEIINDKEYFEYMEDDGLWEYISEAFNINVKNFDDFKRKYAKVAQKSFQKLLNVGANVYWQYAEEQAKKEFKTKR